MGWTVGYDSKQELIDHLVGMYSKNRPTQKYLRHSIVGNSLWFLHKFDNDPQHGNFTFITLALMRSYPEQGGRRVWGYKTMGESSFPSQMNCPASFLRASTDPQSEWREHCLLTLENKALVKERFIKPGQSLPWGDSEITLESNLGSQGWLVRTSSGATYRANSQIINTQLEIMLEDRGPGRQLYESLLELDPADPRHPANSMPDDWRIDWIRNEQGYVTGRISAVPSFPDLCDAGKAFYLNQALGGEQYKHCPGLLGHAQVEEDIVDQAEQPFERPRQRA